MELKHSKLISNLEKSTNYLSQKVATEPRYSDLIETLNLAIDRLKTADKPVIKIVSPSGALAKKILNVSEVDSQLRSLYEFEVVSPIKNLQQIINNCDIICLIYNSQHQIIKHHQKLIELAEENDISLVVLVEQDKLHSPHMILVDWLISQNCVHLNQISLVLDDFIELNNYQHVALYKQFLIQQSTIIKLKFAARINKEIVAQIEGFFKKEITDTWQKIKQIKNKYLSNELVHDYQQKIRQYFIKINKKQQQLFREIKQIINHSKIDYLNPYLPNSWIFSIQQLIQKSQIKVNQENKETFVYLTVNHAEYIHDYILDFCQDKITESLQFQWRKINYDYADGGIQALVNKINTELETITPLYISEIDLPEITFIPADYPRLDLEQIIDRYCLKINSRITFDYDYTQSSWFRLFISVLVGAGIYLTTKLYFGTGKYIGFVILIFQTINLITGQNIKTLKLKQHKKELQRTIDNKYQSLVRIIVDKLSQILIATIEQESQKYQNKIDAIAMSAQTKLDEIKQTINDNKSRIDKLKQDQEHILSIINNQ